jgi:hypothetical protein
MKKIVLSLICAAGMPMLAQAQSVGDILNKINGSGSKSSSGSSSSTSSGQSTPLSFLGNSEIASGLQEALKVGAKNATANLMKTNGFFGNSLIKILMPPQVQQIEAKLRQFGLGSVADKAILAMNRAAEDASGKALPILTNAITSMSIQDGVSILKGGNTAATDYLRGKTTAQLTDAFRPVISASMNKYNVEQLWANVFSTYNKLPIIKDKVNTDITGYVTERALSGVFTTIGQEEKKIRQDPAGTANNLITRVFTAK